MARLSLSTFTCPTAELGEENPHAALRLPFPVVAHYEGQEMPVEHCLPYGLLDGYGRRLEEREHRVAILESDRLRAMFLLDLGGRLWSLVHKPSGRELVSVNPVIQFANFGIRDAWFSGGIEWNVGLFGHSVFTCAPVFAGRTDAPDGSDGFRIWEYERVRGVAWQVDFWAPDGSEFLFYSPRIVNRSQETLPMYWWTCIAAPETPGGRVLAPATTALEPAHAMGEETRTIDLQQEPSTTYPQERSLPRDTYFNIPEGERPFVAHIEPDGMGLLHVSSPQLKGRKQWVWGMQTCGRRWQEWLSPGGPPYLEIQGGLAPKQSDYVPMPGHAEWSWLEAVGPLEMEMGRDWNGAVFGATAELNRRLPENEFVSVCNALGAAATRPPAEIVHLGAGWGALEVEFSQYANLPVPFDAATPFPPESMSEDQAFWQGLIRGAFRSRPPESSPGGYMADPKWLTSLYTLRSLREQPDWVFSLHEGIVRFAAGSLAEAKVNWEHSLQLTPNGWAARNLALLEEMDGNLTIACERILEAHALLPNDRTIVVEACRLLAEAEEYELLERFLDDLSRELGEHPRARLARARVALFKKDSAELHEYFRSRCDLVDIREAETTVSDLWRGLCSLNPSVGDPNVPPFEWDFRMRAEGGAKS